MNARVLSVGGAVLGLAVGVCYGQPTSPGKVTFVDDKASVLAVNDDHNTLIAVVVQNTGSAPAAFDFRTIWITGAAGPARNNVANPAGDEAAAVAGGESAAALAHDEATAASAGGGSHASAVGDITGVGASLDLQTSALETNQYRTLRLEIHHVRPLQSGYLVVLTNGIPTGFLPLKLTASGDGLWSWLPLAVGLVIAVVVIGFCVLQLKRNSVPLSTPMGAAKWDFNTSWASNLTVAGGLFTTAVALAALPDQTELVSKDGYSVVSVFLTLLTGLAPFAYNILRHNGTPAGQGSGEDKGDDAETLVGTVRSFLGSSLLTLLAVVAQLATDGLIMVEICYAKLASHWVIAVFGLLLLGVAVVTVVYAARSIVMTAERATLGLRVDQADGPSLIRGSRANLSGVPIQSSRNLPPEKLPRREWSVL